MCLAFPRRRTTREATTVSSRPWSGALIYNLIAGVARHTSLETELTAMHACSAVFQVLVSYEIIEPIVGCCKCDDLTTGIVGTPRMGFHGKNAMHGNDGI